MKRIIFIAGIISLIFSSLLSLGQEEKKGGGIILEQSDGTKLEIPEYPLRVISLGPNITETIFALGKEDLLVGRTDFCDYPEEVSSIASVGSLSEPSIEEIVLLKPDLVIASTHSQPAVIDKITSLGIPVLRLYTDDSFSGVYNLILQTGKALNGTKEAELLVKEMKEQVKRVTDFVSDREKPVIYYVIGYGEYGDFTAGGNTFIGQMINMAGAVNAAQDLNGWRFSLEELIVQDPSLIICSQYWNTKEGLMDSVGYRELTAVKEGRVFTIDNNKLDRQGPRLAQGLQDLAEIIHGPIPK
jgi:iron complex transport system substrate-binding protein